MSDLNRALTLLREENHTCVLCCGAVCDTDDRRGIAPLLLRIRQGISLQGFSVADRIIGKAAAFLCIYSGVQAVHGCVMSRSAAAMLQAHGISCTYDVLTEHIINRKGDGICPMEETVMEMTDPAEAFAALWKKYEQFNQEEHK